MGVGDVVGGPSTASKRKFCGGSYALLVSTAQAPQFSKPILSLSTPDEDPIASRGRGSVTALVNSTGMNHPGHP
jgi:hypothetical protein